jgi:NAD+ synthase
MKERFDPNLTIDAAKEIASITKRIRHEVVNTFRKRGAVIGISGGIDSSVALALAVKAMGADKVLGIMLPEQDSDSKSKKLAQELADRYNVRTITEPMSPALEGFGCYARRDEAIRNVFPEYTPTCKMKIMLPQTDYTHDRLNFYQLTVINPDGTASTKRLPLEAYLQIVAA